MKLTSKQMTIVLKPRYRNTGDYNTSSSRMTTPRATSAHAFLMAGKRIIILWVPPEQLSQPQPQWHAQGPERARRARDVVPSTSDAATEGQRER
jgi:hypothetical protein